MTTKEKLKILKNVSKKSSFKNKKPGGIFIELKPEILSKFMTKKSVGGEMLKKIPEGPKGEGLRKLKAERPDVTKKMGYAKKGKMLKANKGMSVKGDDARDIRKVEEKIGASRSSKREKKIMKAALGLGVLATKKGQKAAKKLFKGKMQMSPALNYLGRVMGGEAKSTRGYGAARTSGMGLQDEKLPAGKSLDYYKDLM